MWVPGKALGHCKSSWPLTGKRTKLHQPLLTCSRERERETEIAAVLLTETVRGVLFVCSPLTESRELLKKALGVTHRTSQLLSFFVNLMSSVSGLQSFHRPNAHSFTHYKYLTVTSVGDSCVPPGLPQSCDAQ